MIFKKVFISYKSEETREAHWVAGKLEETGVSCWIAPDSLPGGSSYAEQIPRAIREADAFVLILSSRAQNSKWIPRELDQAINEGKTILPFVIEHCTLNDAFKFYLANVQSYEAWKDKNKAMEAMIREMSGYTGKDRINREALDPPRRGKIWIAAAFLLVLALAAAVLFRNGGTFERENDSQAGDYSFEDQGISFEDSALEEAIRRELKLDDDESLTKENAAFVKELDLSSDGESNSIMSLQGLSAFENLKILNLSGNGITDISEIGSLTKLTDLNLENNQISDIGPLKSLSALKSLDLNGNGDISDISPITGLTNVAMLDLRSNHISRLNGISGMVGLKELYLSRNQIKDISPVSGLHKLTYLSFDYNLVVDIQPLSELKKLKTLTISGNRIEEIDVVTDLPSLTYVDISGNHIRDKSVLEELPDTVKVVQ